MSVSRLTAVLQRKGHTHHDICERPVLGHPETRRRNIFSWNLIIERLRELVVQVLVRRGNPPAFDRPGPRRRGICLMRASEVRKASYFLAGFLTGSARSACIRTSDAYLICIKLDLTE